MNRSSDGTAYVKDDVSVIAHEMGHSAGLAHIWDGQKDKNGNLIIENTPENINNLMNSGENEIRKFKKTGGLELNQKQTDRMRTNIEFQQQFLSEN